MTIKQYNRGWRRGLINIRENLIELLMGVNGVTGATEDGEFFTEAGAMSDYDFGKAEAYAVIIEAMTEQINTTPGEAKK